MVVRSLQKDIGYEEYAEEVNKMTTIPEVIGLSVVDLSATWED